MTQYNKLNQVNNQEIQNAYKQASLATNNVQHVVMLYNTVIKHIRQAQIAAKENKVEKRYHLLDKACDIIDGLQSSLDHEKGEEISKILDDFYLGMYIRIHQLQIEYNEAQYEQLVKEITLMRDAWIDVEKQAAENKLNNPTNQELSNKLSENNNKNTKIDIPQNRNDGNTHNIQCDIDA